MRGGTRKKYMSISKAIQKLIAAQICHPNAVQTLISEAHRELIDVVHSEPSVLQFMTTDGRWHNCIDSKQYNEVIRDGLVTRRLYDLGGSESISEHKDDAAVDGLSVTMKAKLSQQRAKGYGGWDAPECTQQHLSDMLRAHVDKGDPVDVSNFCAFLAARGEGIAALPTPKAEPAIQNPWQQAVDHELVVAHLGVANAATQEEAKKALRRLIQWHIDVATNPAVNGGFELKPSSAQPAVEPVAHRIMRRRPDGEWVNDGRYWSDGAPSADLAASIPSLGDGWRIVYAYASPAPAPNALDAETAIKNCLEAGETMRVLKRVVNLLLESRRNLGPEDHELRYRIDQLFRPDAAIAAQSAQGTMPCQTSGS